MSCLRWSFSSGLRNHIGGLPGFSLPGSPGNAIPKVERLSAAGTQNLRSAADLLFSTSDQFEATGAKDSLDQKFHAAIPLSSIVTLEVMVYFPTAPFHT